MSTRAEHPSAETGEEVGCVRRPTVEQAIADAELLSLEQELVCVIAYDGGFLALGDPILALGDPWAKELPDEQKFLIGNVIDVRGQLDGRWEIINPGVTREEIWSRAEEIADSWEAMAHVLRLHDGRWLIAHEEIGLSEWANVDWVDWGRTCCECGRNGLSEEAGAVCYVLDWTLCESCLDHLYETDEEVREAWDKGY